jgi:hypothetical protein
MHSLLVDTVDRPTVRGILSAIMQSSRCDELHAQIRLLMYVTDTWYAGHRLYTVVILGAVVVAVNQDHNDIDFVVLRKLLSNLYVTTSKCLATIADVTKERLAAAEYRVLGASLTFMDVQAVLKRQYQRNDGVLDDNSLRFHSSFWMNMLGYYERLTNAARVLDDELLRHVNTFLDDVVAMLVDVNPSMHPLLAADGVVEYHEDAGVKLRSRVLAYFDVFSQRWDTFVRARYAA